MFLLLKLSAIILLFLSCVYAKDMPAGSEQFEVSRALFVSLGIAPASCNMNDETVDLICGFYQGDFPTFDANLDAVVAQNVPGLVLAGDWFENGAGLVRDYRSSTGQYLIGYNPGGVVIIAFVSTE